MNFRHILIFIFLFSCTNINKTNQIIFDQKYSNAGFALVFDNNLYKNKTIGKNIDDRSMIIFQRNLKKNSQVKITNLINNKSVIAVVGNKAHYPLFFNSVISKRIAEEIEINIDEPYVQIVEISENSTFIANKAKTFDEEREVAEKAPVLEIVIKDLNTNYKNLSNKDKNIKEFKYVIKIADFYYFKTAKLLKKRIISELNIKEVKINELSKTQFRVYLGPYNNLNNIRKNFNKILKLEFENIEILKL